MIDHLMFISIPGLRPADVHDPRVTPTLHQLASEEASCHLVPTFPCVTSPVQATMLTGAGPGQHGIIANGFYYPERHQVEFWVGKHDLIQRPTIFTRLAEQRPDMTSAAWCAQNIKVADANFIVTPAPRHEPDGSTRPWCYSKPDQLYQELLRPLGGFPLQHYWGPLAGLQSSRWIAEGVLWLAQKHAPNFQFIYLPHLDYAAQRFGPNSAAAAAALSELDSVIGDLMERYNQLAAAKTTAWVLAGEYAFTEVRGAIYPNRILRRHGLLAVREERGHEYLDLGASKAFAMVDHQFAHVFVPGADAEEVAELFAPLDEVADVIVGKERAALGLEHPRCAPVVLISRPDQWFAYYWWMEDAAAPPFAHTVDIHRKPGYDPVELFVDPATRQIPLNANLVKGSHGAPAADLHQHTLLITSEPDLLDGTPLLLRDSDIYGLLCRALRIQP